MRKGTAPLARAGGAVLDLVPEEAYDQRHATDGPMLQHLLVHTRASGPLSPDKHRRERWGRVKGKAKTPSTLRGNARVSKAAEGGTRNHGRYPIQPSATRSDRIAPLKAMPSHTRKVLDSMEYRSSGCVKALAGVPTKERL